MTTRSTLKVAVIGAGMMGSDHIARITRRISGAEVAVIVDPDPQRAAAAAELAPDAATAATFEEALTRRDLDAVLIASPGQFHEAVLLPALERKLAILCEKPLTPDVATALKITEAEQKLERPHIQVGFMRRFDAGYVQLKSMIETRKLGDLLLIHARHRNASSHLVNTEAMLIQDALVHELDVLPWLAGDRIASIDIKKPRPSRLAPEGLRDPQVAILEFTSGTMAIVEIFINARFGYQVKTEAVFEEGTAEIGETDGLRIRHEGQTSRFEPPTFKERFAAAYDTQIQKWVDASKDGRIDGPSAWDGYLAVAAAEAGVEAQRSGRPVEVVYEATPSFYDLEQPAPPRVPV